MVLWRTLFTASGGKSASQLIKMKSPTIHSDPQVCCLLSLSYSPTIIAVFSSALQCWLGSCNISTQALYSSFFLIFGPSPTVWFSHSFPRYWSSGIPSLRMFNLQQLKKTLNCQSQRTCTGRRRRHNPYLKTKLTNRESKKVSSLRCKMLGLLYIPKSLGSDNRNKWGEGFKLLDVCVYFSESVYVFWHLNV